MISAVRAALLPLDIERPGAVMLQTSAFLAALLRGIDYLVMPAGGGAGTLGLVEAALPFHAWGAAFFVAGVIGMIGQLLHRWPIAAVAHGSLVGLFLAFGMGQLVWIASIGETHGWRTGVGWILGGAVVHAVLGEASLDASRRCRWVR